MGKTLETMCYCESSCCKKEITKAEPKETIESKTRIKTRNKNHINSFQKVNIISETITSKKYLRNMDENLILNTDNNISNNSNKNFSLISNLSFITVNSENLCQSENNDSDKSIEEEKFEKLNVNDLRLTRDDKKNFRKTLFNKQSIRSIKKFNRLLSSRIQTPNEEVLEDKKEDENEKEKEEEKEEENKKEEKKEGEKKEEEKKEEEKKEEEKNEDNNKEKENNEEQEKQIENIIYEGEQCIFIGEIEKENPLNGKGTLNLKSGETMEGTFIDGKLNKTGKYTDADGTIFEGEFQNGIINGKGKITQLKESTDKSQSNEILNTIIYTGDIKNFKKEGIGEEACQDYIYKGNFHNNLRNGKGIIKYCQSGDTYDGEFKDDKINGYGTYTWNNNCKYTGEMKDGEMHGKGIFTWPDGCEYNGNYVNGIREGLGTFKWSNGNIFNGQFKNGRPDGIGYAEKNGLSYKVRYKNGLVYKMTPSKK